MLKGSSTLISGFPLILPKIPIHTNIFNRCLKTRIQARNAIKKDIYRNGKVECEKVRFFLMSLQRDEEFLNFSNPHLLILQLAVVNKWQKFVNFLNMNSNKSTVVF